MAFCYLTVIILGITAAFYYQTVIILGITAAFYYLEIGLVSLDHSVEPVEQLLGTVVTMEDHRNAVMLGHQPDVLSSGDRAEDGGLLLLVLDGLAGQEGRATVADLGPML